MKSVAAKPSSTKTKILPFQNDISRSSMAIDPSPIRTLLGQPSVDRQRAQQGQGHQHNGCYR